jgi:Fe-S cluster assembly scaffold protein SufB
MIKEQYNQLPRTTFRWMKVNHLEVEPKTVQVCQAVQPKERHEGQVKVAFYEGSGTFDLGDFTGASQASLTEVLNKSMTGCRIETAPNTQGSVWLTYELDEAHPQLIGQLQIKAGAGSTVKVFITFDGDADGGLVNFLNYIEADDQAVVKISKVQLHGHSVRHIEHRYAKTGKQALVDYVSAELGSKETIVYYKTDLMKEEGKFNSNAMYLGNDQQVFDFSYWVPQQGIKTETDILTTGSLMNGSRKSFRGTIDFLRGGKKAVGSEADVCLLLSPDSHSISVPLLLCKEDDVVGNHASSAGQIDKDMLFYLMSRGFSEAGAQLIIVESNIRPVIDKLGDEEMENKALQAVREKMQFCHKKGDCDDQCTKRFPDLG